MLWLPKIIKKYDKVLFLTLVIILVPTTVFAGPLKPITESDISRSQPTNPYSSLNEILTIVYVVLGFHTTAGFIVATVLLSKSGLSSAKRLLGFAALGTALAAGYLLTKALPIAESITNLF